MAADKTKSIKSATDKEIEELIIRLRKEYELQNLIADIKRRSLSPKDIFDNVSYERPEVSTEQPIESLYHKGEEALAHFGILGMKWGVRRRSRKSSSSSDLGRSGGKNISEDFAKVREKRTKGLQELSTQDLKEITNRLLLEKQYKDLTKKQMSAGKKWIYDVVMESAKDQAKKQVSKYMGIGIDALTKKFAK